MKKILILNGGPRMHNNTAKLLASAGEGGCFCRSQHRDCRFI